MIGLKRVLAYFVILLITALVFWGVYSKLSKSKILDNTGQLQELGLTETGNEFIVLERPTYRQFVSSPLAVKLKLVNTSGVYIYLKDALGKELARQAIDVTPTNLSYVANVQFSTSPGDGFLEIQPFEETKPGVKLPIRFSN